MANLLPIDFSQISTYITLAVILILSVVLCMLAYRLMNVVPAKWLCDYDEEPDESLFGTRYIFKQSGHAYDLAAADPDFHPTDDTRVVVDYLPDEPVAIVSGAETNLKITTLEDIPTAERIAEEILGRDPKEEARARMHALLAQAAGQMHR